jgi:integrase/recombinase XerD
MTPAWEARLREYRRDLELDGYRPRTVAGRLWTLGRFADWCGPRPLTAALLAEYRRHRIERVNGRGRRDGVPTINLHLEGVKGLLAWLVRRGEASQGLVLVLKPLRKPRRLPKEALSHLEVMKILERIPGDRPVHVRDRAALELLYSTGIRRQELVDLGLEAADIAGGTLRVEEGKGGKGRLVPLGKAAGEWVGRYVSTARPALVGRREDPGVLFVSKAGRPLNGNAVREMTRRWAQAAGISKEVSPHTFRRSCATGMIRNRANPAHVKDLLGHSDFASLDAYVRLEIADLQEAHRRFHPREREGSGRSRAEPLDKHQL